MDRGLTPEPTYNEQGQPRPPFLRPRPRYAQAQPPNNHPRTIHSKSVLEN